jgi:hypothetical protein
MIIRESRRSDLDMGWGLEFGIWNLEMILNYCA